MVQRGWYEENVDIFEGYMQFLNKRLLVIFLTKGMMTRFYPLYEELRKALRENTIGDVEAVIASMGFPLFQEQPSDYHKQQLWGAVPTISCTALCYINTAFRDKPQQIIAHGCKVTEGTSL